MSTNLSVGEWKYLHLHCSNDLSNGRDIGSVDCMNRNKLECGLRSVKSSWTSAFICQFGKSKFTLHVLLLLLLLGLLLLLVLLLLLML